MNYLFNIFFSPSSFSFKYHEFFITNQRNSKFSISIFSCLVYRIFDFTIPITSRYRNPLYNSTIIPRKVDPTYKQTHTLQRAPKRTGETYIRRELPDLLSGRSEYILTWKLGRPASKSKNQLHSGLCEPTSPLSFCSLTSVHSSREFLLGAHTTAAYRFVSFSGYARLPRPFSPDFRRRATAYETFSSFLPATGNLSSILPFPFHGSLLLLDAGLYIHTHNILIV